jgi:peptidylprolyl isomerase
VSKKLYFIIAAVLVGFYFFQTYTPSLSEGELAANKQAAMDYLALNQSVEGVKTTQSGLQYKVLQTGTGTVHPKVTDRVTVHYDGSLIDGTVFDSSVKRDKPITFGLDKVIRGWKEGLPLMVVGDKTRFFIPPNLAYGEQWAGDIPPNSTLIFDVELLAINE